MPWVPVRRDEGPWGAPTVSAQDVGMTTRIEMMDRARCLELLRADEIGRLAVVADGGPLILPVNYRVDGESIVFRTDPG